MSTRYAVYYGNLRIGVYTHRENAGRRALAIRRKGPGKFQKLKKPGTWRSYRTGHHLRIQPELVTSASKKR